MSAFSERVKEIHGSDLLLTVNPYSVIPEDLKAQLENGSYSRKYAERTHAIGEFENLDIKRS